MNELSEHHRPANFQPIRIGRRLTVVPASHALQSTPEMIPIRLDPGSAFGTGAHPTTQLCLAALERHLPSGKSVIDLGTGTGILAIAAARLGAGSVLALDNDPEAVAVAGNNIIANGLTDKVLVREGSLSDVLVAESNALPVSVAIINILAKVILEFFEQGLSQTVAPDGLLILSGLLRSQTPEVRARLQWHGLELMAQEQRNGWACIIARRP